MNKRKLLNFAPKKQVIKYMKKIIFTSERLCVVGTFYSIQSIFWFEKRAMFAVVVVF